MNGVMIWLGPHSKATDEGSRFLDILFDRDMTAGEKGDLLQQEFKIPRTTTMEKEMEEMGALSAGIRLEGEKEGMKKGEHNARREGAARAAELLLEAGFGPDQIVRMIREKWPELTEKDVLAAVSSATGA